MACEETPVQLQLFPETGIEGHWLEFPYDFARVDPDLVALCNKYGFARLCQADSERPRKAATPISKWGPWPRSLIGDEVWSSLLKGFSK